MQFYTTSNFDEVIAALPRNCRPIDPEQRRDFRVQIEALLDTYFFKLPPTLTASEFGVLSEKVNRRRPKGGRPRHISMDTLIFALADLYAKKTSSQVEVLPVSESSRFVIFLDSCLSPLYQNADLSGALGRRWRDLRKAILALPSSLTDQSGKRFCTSRHQSGGEYCALY